MSQALSNIISHSTQYTGNWLSLKTVSVEVSGKKLENYEYIEYNPAKKFNKNLNGVSIAPLIKYQTTNKIKIVVVANFRPPINNYILEFPGGFVENDSYEVDAFRELKEETGYTGKTILNKPQTLPCFYDSWKSKENGRLLIIEIDGDDEKNQNPPQKLEKDEVIKVFLLDFNSKLPEQISELSEKHGFAVSDQLYTFALGLSFNFGFGLSS